MSTGFSVRVCDVFGTPYRRYPWTLPQKDFDLTPQFERFYEHYLPKLPPTPPTASPPPRSRRWPRRRPRPEPPKEPRQILSDQEVLPRLVAQRVYDLDKTRLTVVGSTDPADEEAAALFQSRVGRIEVVLFALPIPVSQVVAAVVIDLTEDELRTSGRIGKLRDAMIHDNIWLDDYSVLRIVDELARQIGATPEADPAWKAAKKHDTAKDPLAVVDLQRPFKAGERHVLVFAHPADQSVAAAPEGFDATAEGLVVGAHWPWQPEFTKVYRPPSLNTEDRTRSAVLSHYASVLYGQTDQVDTSALLITTQTVGTAARFQEIWQKAFNLVSDFQDRKGSRTHGEETRRSLADLADEMGNLELDLTFNVQTAADLGLGSTTAFVNDFHTKLRKAMEFPKRAKTVANMFERVNSSINSELTAIISKEREHDERRRRLGTLALGGLTFVLAPVTVLLGYFGLSTGNVTGDDSILFFHHFWGVYAFAGLLMAFSVGVAIAMAVLPRGGGRRGSARSTK